LPDKCSNCAWHTQMLLELRELQPYKPRFVRAGSAMDFFFFPRICKQKVVALSREFCIMKTSSVVSIMLQHVMLTRTAASARFTVCAQTCLNMSVPWWSFGRRIPAYWNLESTVLCPLHWPSWPCVAHVATCSTDVLALLYCAVSCHCSRMNVSELKATKGIWWSHLCMHGISSSGCVGKEKAMLTHLIHHGGMPRSFLVYPPHFCEEILIPIFIGLNVPCCYCFSSNNLTVRSLYMLEYFVFLWNCYLLS
jgi:hypothetical protein